MAELHLPLALSFSKEPMSPANPRANELISLPMMLKPIKQKLHAARGGGAPRCKNLTRRLARLRRRPAVSGLFRRPRKRSKKGSLPVPSLHGHDGSGDAGTGTDTDTDASDGSEEEKEFFEDLRRVRKGELTSKARVDLPRRSSMSRVLGLLCRKGGGAFSTLLRRAKASVHDHAVRKDVGEEEERVKGMKGGEWGGGGLCERKVLVGRRSKRHEASVHGCFFIGREATSSF